LPHRTISTRPARWFQRTRRPWRANKAQKRPIVMDEGTLSHQLSFLITVNRFGWAMGCTEMFILIPLNMPR